VNSPRFWPLALGLSACLSGCTQDFDAFNVNGGDLRSAVTRGTDAGTTKGAKGSKTKDPTKADPAATGEPESPVGSADDDSATAEPDASDADVPAEDDDTTARPDEPIDAGKATTVVEPDAAVEPAPSVVAPGPEPAPTTTEMTDAGNPPPMVDAAMPEPVPEPVCAPECSTARSECDVDCDRVEDQCLLDCPEAQGKCRKPCADARASCELGCLTTCDDCVRAAQCGASCP
jgi:hypothetical protein